VRGVKPGERGATDRTQAAEPARPKRRFFRLFLVLLVGYYLFRIGLAVMDLTGSIPLDRDPGPAGRTFLDASEMLTGLVGLIAVPGLLLSKRWGYCATMGVSGYAVAFDSWATLTIQVSAAGGAIVPLLWMIWLSLYRQTYSLSEAPTPAARPTR